MKMIKHLYYPNYRIVRKNIKKFSCLLVISRDYLLSDCHLLHRWNARITECRFGEHLPQTNLRHLQHVVCLFGLAHFTPCPFFRWSALKGLIMKRRKIELNGGFRVGALAENNSICNKRSRRVFAHRMFISFANIRELRHKSQMMVKFCERPCLRWTLDEISSHHLVSGTNAVIYFVLRDHIMFSLRIILSAFANSCSADKSTTFLDALLYKQQAFGFPTSKMQSCKLEQCSKQGFAQFHLKCHVCSVELLSIL